jgi:hypothetical protein
VERQAVTAVQAAPAPRRLGKRPLSSTAAEATREISAAASAATAANTAIRAFGCGSVSDSCPPDVEVSEDHHEGWAVVVARADRVHSSSSSSSSLSKGRRNDRQHGGGDSSLVGPSVKPVTASEVRLPQLPPGPSWAKSPRRQPWPQQQRRRFRPQRRIAFRRAMLASVWTIASTATTTAAARAVSEEATAATRVQVASTFTAVAAGGQDGWRGWRGW